MVEINLNGRMELLAIRLAPEAVNPQDIGMLEDLITAAYAGAFEKIKEEINREMGAMAGGLGIPGLAGGLPPGFGIPGVS
jgi:DNA-binding protein YbaB